MLRAAGRAGPGAATAAGGRKRVRRGFAAVALSVAGLTLAARILGFGRSLVFSKTVGDTCLGDVYNAANSLPNALFEIVAGGVLAGVVIPVVARHVGAGRRAEAGADRVGPGHLDAAGAHPGRPGRAGRRRAVRPGLRQGRLRRQRRGARRVAGDVRPPDLALRAGRGQRRACCRPTSGSWPPPPRRCCPAWWSSPRYLIFAGLAGPDAGTDPAALSRAGAAARWAGAPPPGCSRWP